MPEESSIAGGWQKKKNVKMGRRNLKYSGLSTRMQWGILEHRRRRKLYAAKKENKK